MHQMPINAGQTTAASRTTSPARCAACRRAATARPWTLFDSTPFQRVIRHSCQHNIAKNVLRTCNYVQTSSVSSGIARARVQPTHQRKFVSRQVAGGGYAAGPNAPNWKPFTPDALTRQRRVARPREGARWNRISLPRPLMNVARCSQPSATRHAARSQAKLIWFPEHANYHLAP